MFAGGGVDDRAAVAGAGGGLDEADFGAPTLTLDLPPLVTLLPPAVLVLPLDGLADDEPEPDLDELPPE